jgi:hypothetical protein
VCSAVLGFSEEPLILVLKTKLEQFCFFKKTFMVFNSGSGSLKKKVPVMVLADLVTWTGTDG